MTMKVTKPVLAAYEALNAAGVDISVIEPETVFYLVEKERRTHDEILQIVAPKFVPDAPLGAQEVA